MNIKKITAAFLILLLAINTADAVKYKKFNLLLKKAIRSYHRLGTSPIGWKVLGISNWKNKIYYKEFGSGEKLTMIIGGIHGDEPAGFISALKLAQYINNNPESILNRVVIIPCLNPDGLISGRRTNGNRVDINRNFPADNWSQEFKKKYNNSGNLPASEPETVLIVNAIENYKPALIIQMHQPFNVLNAETNTSAELTAIMSKITGLPVVENIGYSTPGSLGSYHTALDYKVQGITVELCSIDREPDYKKVIESLIEAINYRENIQTHPYDAGLPHDEVKGEADDLNME